MILDDRCDVPRSRCAISSHLPWMFALGPKLAGSTGDNPCDIFRKRHDTSQHVTTCHMSQQPEILPANDLLYTKH